MSEREKNIVMFPFMAQGHIIPFLALARHILHTCNSTTTSTTYTITFVTTPLNAHIITSSLPPNSNIRLLQIPFSGSDHGLPPHVENTDSLPYHLLHKFLRASLCLKPSFSKLLSDLISQQHGRPPLCIIADVFFGWCADIARHYGVFNAIFCGGGGFGFACYHSLWLNLPHRNTDSHHIMIPDFPEASTIHVTQMSDLLRAADGHDTFSMFNREVLSAWSKADAILFNTLEVLDRTGLKYFRRKLGRPVWAVGPVNLSIDNQAHAEKEGGNVSDMCTQWLDRKPAKSVVYVSFGSQNTISTSQMIELAIALEASCKNFVWVVNPPAEFDTNSEFRAKEWLPHGFEERIKESNRGLLAHKWAPQLDILSHEAVSVFLSHCGWNSVMEALGHGVPILGWPLAAEQFYNAKLLEEEVGVCVEVARGKSIVRHEDLAAKIELVMNGTEKGTEMTRKACEVREMIKNAMKDEDGLKGSSVKAMHEFLSAATLMTAPSRSGPNN
ncbi:hypothetical protein FNV43_RR03008 [Rhamnella rubrinervis]|uniref:Glycosyltransferase n=1 Tax=Rhamnella rubrinervis TaxID=2594499 RepID=A0A8K0HHN4_9ROSA|nr:hypothetical protein FNV43_RR03008 [Rhamnella rubrinervis]